MFSRSIVVSTSLRSIFSDCSSFQLTALRSYTTKDITDHFNNTLKSEKSINNENNVDVTNTEKKININESDVITSSVIEETRLHPSLKRAFIKNVGPTLTPVQEKCINEFLSSENGIVVRAKTGTGKTFAFGIPTIHSVLSSKDKGFKHVDQYVNSVVFAPTRDLAFQTRKSLSDLWSECIPKKRDFSGKDKRSYNKKSRTPERNQELIPLVIGQTPYRQTMSHFIGKEAPPIVVATPGRFIDMLENEPKFRSKFKYLQNFIIDEADELLNGNFKDDILKVIDELESIREPIPGIEDINSKVSPKKMLFSATVNDDVMDLAEHAIGEDFPFIDVTGNKSKEVNENITQKLVQTDSIFDTYVAATKFILDHVHEKDFKPIIFLSTTSSVDFVSYLLNGIFKSEGIRRRVLSFHGKLTQGKRDASQRIFRENDKSILVASGIGARGMDFPNVSHVIQIGVSSEIDSHTHKIGRTGRAGKKGDALLFTSKLETPFVKALTKTGNKFETIEFDSEDPEVAEISQKIIDETSRYDELYDTCFKIISHYRNIPTNIARLDLSSLAIDVSRTYQKLLGEGNGNDNEDDEYDRSKLSMSYEMAKKMGLDFSAIEDDIILTGRRPSSNNNRNNNRNSKRGNWNDRNNRGSRNNRGGRNDRNDRNDRRDRSSRW